MAAQHEVPVVLVTGDRRACEETAALLPGVPTAVVKEPVSRLAAHSLHPARACALIREVAEKGVATAGQAAAHGGRSAAAGSGPFSGLRPARRPG